MKKSISILSLITVITTVQSCERTDMVTDSEISETSRTKDHFRSAENLSKEADQPSYDQQHTNHLKTGEEEEPRRDKQHWRISSDSLR